MGFPNVEIISFIEYLLPGFVAAWIFHGLTAHLKPTPFEQIVKALIFTAFTKPLVGGTEVAMLGIGSSLGSVGTWTDTSSLTWSLLYAIVLGFGFSSLANTGHFHDWLPDWITKRTSFPSEWFSAFNKYKRYVYLHLKGDRRLRGWATEWPDQPDSGHFVVQQAAWILDDNTRVPLHLTEAMLVPASEVEMVEFETPPDQRNYDEAEFVSGERRLIALRSKKTDKEKPNGERTPAPCSGDRVAERSAAESDGHQQRA